MNLSYTRSRLCGFLRSATAGPALPGPSAPGARAPPRRRRAVCQCMMDGRNSCARFINSNLRQQVITSTLAINSEVRPVLCWGAPAPLSPQEPCPPLGENWMCYQRGWKNERLALRRIFMWGGEGGERPPGEPGPRGVEFPQERAAPATPPPNLRLMASPPCWLT